MNLDTFFEKFDLFADAPGAVAKMRELVLHLAVTGKLVEQDPKDEPGDLLIKKISKERLAAVRARKIGPIGPLPTFGKDDFPFQLRPGWAVARLIELVMEIQTGPFGSSLHKSDYQVGGTPVINPASLKNGKIVPIEEMAIGPSTLQRLEVFKLAAGDIVMARRGEMGRCAIVTRNEEGWLCGTGSLVLRMPSSLFAPYLAMQIGAPMARSYLGGASVGATMQNLNQAILAKLPVGVPPLAEQKRIVAKVDELMVVCDQLEAQQQERQTRHAALARASLSRVADAPTPANLDLIFHPSYDITPADLRKSILALAVQGKLVPQDPGDEPADVCLARLELGSTVALLNTSVGEHDSLPAGWELVRFDDVAVVSGGVTLGRKLADREIVTLPYLRVANVKRGEIDLAVVKEVSIPKDEIERYALREDDLLMTEGGDWDKVGRAAIWRAEIPVCLHQNHVFRARMRAPELTPFWFERYFNSPIGRRYFESAAKQTTNLASINMRQVRSCQIPLPPLAEQRRIVARVDQLMALVDKLETQLAASRATATALLSALGAELTARTHARS